MMESNTLDTLLSSEKDVCYFCRQIVMDAELVRLEAAIKENGQKYHRGCYQYARTRFNPDLNPDFVYARGCVWRYKPEWYQ